MLSTLRVSPSLISPVHLRAVLNEIFTRLPKHYIFFANPEKELWHFYEALTNNTIIILTKLIISMDIPLLEVDSKFDLYNAYNFGIPYMPENISESEEKSPYGMTATYKLEAPAVMINHARAHYSLLTRE